MVLDFLYIILAFFGYRAGGGAERKYDWLRGGSFYHILLYLDHGLEYIWSCLYGFRVYLDVFGNIWLFFNVTWYVWVHAGGGVKLEK